MIPFDDFGFWRDALDVTVNAAALTTLVAGVAYWVNRQRQYRRNLFANKFSATLNRHDESPTGNALALRMVYEGTASEVFSEEPIRDAYLAAASGTTVRNPFVIIPDQKTRRAVLSDFVRHFQKADSLVALMQHLGVTNLKGVKIIGIATFERFPKGDERWHMNRPWLFTEQQLARFAGDNVPKLDAKGDHGERIPWIHAFANIMMGKPVPVATQLVGRTVKGFTDAEVEFIKAMAFRIDF
jgi:hypothetical protein